MAPLFKLVNHCAYPIRKHTRVFLLSSNVMNRKDFIKKEGERLSYPAIDYCAISISPFKTRNWH